MARSRPESASGGGGRNAGDAGLGDPREPLARAERRYAELFDFCPDPLVVHDAGGLILEANEGFRDRTGYRAEEIVGKPLLESPLLRDARTAPWESYLGEVLGKGLARDVEVEFRLADGELVSSRISGRLSGPGGSARVLSIIRDIGGGQDSDLARLESDFLYREAFRQSTAVKLLIDPETLRIIDANEAAVRFYGYPAERLTTMRISDINPSPEGDIRGSVALARSREQSRFVYKHRTASGELRDVEIYTGAIRLGGRELLHSIIHDITEKVRAEEELKRLVEEKETLMKELQHRVKNNLGVVTGLLGLSAGRVRDDEAREAFASAISRIESIAALYAKLYGTKDLVSIDLGTYVEDLVKSLFSTYNLEPGRIRLKSRFDAVCLDLKRSVPFGLVLNELVSNAIKYAYPDGASGEIRVELRADGGMVSLNVSDDGPGIPPEALDESSSGLGLTLVRMLSEQLHASLDIDCSRGASVTIRFEA